MKMTMFLNILKKDNFEIGRVFDHLRFWLFDNRRINCKKQGKRNCGLFINIGKLQINVRNAEREYNSQAII